MIRPTLIKKTYIEGYKERHTFGRKDKKKVNDILTEASIKLGVSIEEVKRLLNK